MTKKIKYIEAYVNIKNDIASGKYKEEDFLPSETELCKIYGVGRSTLRRALMLLADENLIVAKQGIGTIVTAHAGGPYQPTKPLDTPGIFVPHCLVEPPHAYTESPISTSSLAAPDQIAEKMGLPAGSRVFLVQKSRYINGESYCHIASYVNPSVAPDLDKHDIGSHITEFLVRQYGLKRAATDESLEIFFADAEKARLFGVEEGRACFVHCRTAYVAGNNVYDYSELIFNPRIIQLKLIRLPDAQLDIINTEDDDLMP